MWTRPRSWLPEPLVDLYDYARFEWKGAMGRFLSPRELSTSGKRYLNLGSGHNDGALPEEFFNVDYYTAGRGLDAYIDLRFPLPFTDNAWSGVYSHHVLEHLEYRHACALLHEIHRVLKPGGLVRLVVPDSERVIRLYASDELRDREQLLHLFTNQTAKFRSPAEVINYVFHCGKFNRHLFGWDFETLAMRLADAGFAAIRKAGCNDSVNPSFNIDRAHWAPQSLYVEATKKSPPLSP
jgi:predicted SAM-dependent methyltransferase